MTDKQHRTGEITLGVNVEGVEKLQDTADILSEIMPSITIRNNAHVNVTFNLMADRSVHNEQPDVMMPSDCWKRPVRGGDDHEEG